MKRTHTPWKSRSAIALAATRMSVSPNPYQCLMRKSAPALDDIDSIRGQALRSLFDAFERLAEGAFVVDAQSNIVWANERYLQFIGHGQAASSLVGRHIRDVVPTTRMPEVVKTGRSIPLDFIEVNGTWAVVSRFPIKDQANRVTGGFCFVLFDDLDLVQPMVSRISELQDELKDARSKLDRLRGAKYDFSKFVGSSVKALEVMLQARQVAAMDSTVLLQGETGTGKELIAQAIHAASRRSKHNFVAVNVAAIPEDLMEAEFFGTGPGAYTGASAKGRVGKMVIANHGTLFLDEIADMPMRMQVKLLRALQEREVEPVGSNNLIKLDVRVIAASSQSLDGLVARGEFRADLYYRLNVVPIRLPPLRERMEDIPALAEALLVDVCHALQIRLKTIEPSAFDALMAHDWPGNIRELRNVIERACVANAAGGVITARQLQLSASGPALGRGFDASIKSAVGGLERTMIQDALVRASGNKVATARLLGISRSNLYKKLESLGLGKLESMPSGE